MHQQDVLIRSRLWRDEISLLGNLRLNQPLMDTLVLFGREDMRADREAVVVTVD
jgi:hypothetical protein